MTRGRRFRTEQDIYQALWAKLGAEPREDVWANLVRRRFVKEVVQGDADLEELLEEYRAEAAIFSPRRRPREGQLTHETPPDQARLILSQLLALDAAQDAEVVAFRQKILGGQLIPLEKVKEWIDGQAEKDGQATLYATIALPADTRPRLADDGLYADPPLPDKVRLRRTELILLSYFTPDRGTVNHAPVADGGTLFHLYHLARALAQRYTWHEAAAATFVLTGAVPRLPLARTTITLHSGFAALGQVSMTFGFSLAPKDVAAAYARARRDWEQQTAKMPGLMFLYGGLRERKRRRPMSEKHLTLAVFAHEHRHIAGEKWVEVMVKWNAEHPDWPYTRFETFARDAVVAWRRLTGENDLQPMGKEKGATNV